MADNILEAVLSKDIDKRFEAIDKRLESIEKHTENTVKALGGLGATLVNEFGTMSKGVESLSAGIDKLNESLKKMGSVSSSSASSATNSITNVAAQLNRLYSEKLRYENELYKLNTQGKAKNIERGGSGLLVESEYFKAGREYIALLDKVEEKIKVLKERNREAAAEARQIYDAKSMAQHLRNEEQRAKALDRTREAMRRLNEQQKKNAQKDFNATLGFGTAPQTIEQYRIAIRNLKAEIDRLSPNNKAGIAELNEQINKYKKKLEEAGVAQKNFNDQTNKLGISLRNLASTFGIVFSVQSLANFGRKIVEITGEFELQHRSLQAIIGDMDAANKLWDKTIALAVKSPYRVKDLVSYTKQLAAYRIETDKLYDTTKMLADISSGLGVDMKRLILAYGQVKAANYLRGQELRQFSEAGVNILGELANYFSELQGRAISTGDVFEMVSKRMVKFEDVATVLRRLTEEGGIFFNMQEQQAETIQGQLMNLRDSFDLFMNSIGEKRSGLIIETIKTVRNTLEDITRILPTIDVMLVALAARFAVLKTSALVTKITTGEWVGMFGKNMTMLLGQFAAWNLQHRIHHANMRKSIILGERLRNVEIQIAAARKAGGTMLGGWLTLASVAAVAIAALVQKTRKANEEANKLKDEIQKINTENAATTTKSVAQYKELANKINDVNTSESERSHLMQRMKQLYGEILPERLRNIDYIKREGIAYEEAIDSITNYYLAIRREKEIEATINDNESRIEKQMDDIATSLQKQIKNIDKVDVPIYNIKTALRKLREEYDAGSVSIENYNERLLELLQLEAGVPITMQSLRQYMGSMSADGSSVYTQLAEPLITSFETANKKLQEVTGRTEDFGKKMKEALQADVFDKAIKIMNEQLDNDVSAGLMGKSFEEALEYRAKFAEYFFERRFENFKNGDYYKSLSDVQKKEIENQFRNMLNEQVLKQQVSNAADTIAKSLDDLIDKYNLNDKQAGLLQKFLIGNEESNKEYYDRAKKEVENVLSDIRDYENGVYNIPMVLSPESRKEKEKEIKDTVAMKDAYEALLKILELFWGTQKKSGGSSGNQALQLLNKQIEAIKNASKQYEEYQKLYDDTTAFTKTKNAVQDLFGQLGIGGLLNKQGIFDKMTIQSQLTTWLSGQMAKAGKDGRIAIEKYIRELELQASQADFKKMVDNFKRNMDEAFADYDMYKELEKLGIGKDFASLLFGVQTFDDKQLSQKFEQAKRHLLSIYDGDEAQKAVAEMQRKIDEAEDKAQKERLKKYVAYTKQAMTERAKIEVEGLLELAEIEMTFQKEIEKAQNTGNTERASQIKQLMDAAVAGSKRATNEKLQKQAWEDFKGSDMYVEMFNDIGNASTKVINAIQDKITQLRGSLKDLNPSDLKAITQEITKLEDELIKRNPAKSYFDLFKQVRNLQKQGKGEDALMLQMGANDAEIENLNDQIAGYERLIEKRRQFSQEQIDSEGESNYLKINMSLQSQVEEWKKLVDQKKKDNAITAEELATYKRFRNASQEFANYLQNMGGRVASIFSDIMSNLEAFGGETTNTTEAWGDLFTSITSIIATIPNYILLMKAAGVAANEALGVIGWIITAAELLMSLIKGIANIKNAQIDDEIEGYRKSVDGLSDAYDRLENKFDSVWDIERLRNYNSEMKRNIEEQISYYDKMIDAEMRRKSPDQGIIDDYRKSIQDLRDDIASQGNDFLTEVGGLGTDSYKDAAQGFVDAWYDAFKETGDGLEGLRDNFNEILENMVKRQAVMQLTNAILDPLFKEIDTAAGDGTITNAEMDAINSLAETTFPTLNEKLKAFFQSLGMFGEQAEGELDGLQKGIQGVTEQTAEIIAAYMNAIRYYVIDNNTKLGQIVGIVQDNTGAANPMLAELRSLRQRADDIHYLLNGWRETNGIDSMRVTIVN